MKQFKTRSYQNEKDSKNVIKGSQYDTKITRVLKKMGFVNSTKISDTLQGSIWRGWKQSDKSTKPESTVIKVTNEYLHKHSLSIVNNKQYKVNEDILLEQSILKYLTEFENCPDSIVKFKQFAKTKTEYILCMEDGGMPLFSFIESAHKLILSGKIDINHWRKVVQIIFNQMIECIEYTHSKNVSHFDISLENFVINDVQCEVHRYNGTETIQFMTEEIQIKLCDFGLAKLFTSSTFHSNKYCGKPNYKSPEVINKIKKFDAKMNDIWCLGVCLFMMMTGTAPWKVANEKDQCFVYIMNGKMNELLKAWNLLQYVDTNLIDLLQSIFKYEADRINLSEIKQHPWTENISNCL